MCIAWLFGLENFETSIAAIVVFVLIVISYGMFAYGKEESEHDDFKF